MLHPQISFHFKLKPSELDLQILCPSCPRHVISIYCVNTNNAFSTSLQKHAYLRAHEFAHCSELWNRPRLASVTCGLSWKLDEINPDMSNLRLWVFRWKFSGEFWLMSDDVKKIIIAWAECPWRWDNNRKAKKSQITRYYSNPSRKDEGVWEGIFVPSSINLLILIRIRSNYLN